MEAPQNAPRRSKTVSLRHAFTRLNSHVNKRGANHSPITPDIISRPSNAIKFGGPHPLSTEISHSLDDDTTNTNTTTNNGSSRPRATSGGTLPSSSSSFASRWKSGHARSSSNPSNLPPVLPPSQQQLHQPVYYSPPGTVPTSPTLSATTTTTTSPTTTSTTTAVALTDEERSELARMPGTIFLKTARSNGESGDGELIIEEHRLKPRKGMQGSGDAGKCRFCRRGPFPNMWVCLDSCGFVMCRVCANESVQGGEAELF